MGEVLKMRGATGPGATGAGATGKGTAGRGTAGRGVGGRGVGGAVDETEPQLNLAVVCGPCSGPPEVRVLESGTRLASLSVRCPTGGADERATSVPVTVWNPAAWVETLEAGDAVLVVGQVRRRFFGRAGGVGSRVDVEAVSIARARDRRRVDAALRRVAGQLDSLG